MWRETLFSLSIGFKKCLFLSLIFSTRNSQISLVFSDRFFISVFFVVRLQSYEALLFNNEIFLDDPRTNVMINENIGYEKYIGNWVRPSEGDQCWANLNCTMSSQDIIIIDDGVFKVAYRK